MNVHPNAKLTPRCRLLLVERILGGWDPCSAAEAVGVSRRTGMKWLARYRAEGLDGLLDRSSRPHRSPGRTPGAIVEKVRELRLLKMTGRRIAQLLGLARSTVHRILVRLGLNRASSLEPREPTNSYEWPKPGEMLHLDVAPLNEKMAVS